MFGLNTDLPLLCPIFASVSYLSRKKKEGGVFKTERNLRVRHAVSA